MHRAARPNRFSASDVLRRNHHNGVRETFPMNRVLCFLNAGCTCDLETSEFEELVERFTPYVKARARKLARLDAMEYDDLVQVGCMALVECLQCNDPIKGPLRPYVFDRIRWRMCDVVRSFCRDRDRFRAMEKKIRSERGERPVYRNRSETVAIVSKLEKRDFILSLVSKLPGNGQKLIGLKLQGLSRREIADTLRINMRSQDDRVTRVYRHFRFLYPQEMQLRQIRKESAEFRRRKV